MNQNDWNAVDQIKMKYKIKRNQPLTHERIMQTISLWPKWKQELIREYD